MTCHSKGSVKKQGEQSPCFLFNLNTMNKKQITITEDQALGLGKNLSDLVVRQIECGYRVVTSYMHPAVGKCYVLEQV